MHLHISTLMLLGILGAVQPCYAQAEKDSTTIEEVKKETQDLLQSIGSFTADKKDQAVEQAKDSLNKLDQRIDALEAKIDKNFDEMNDAAREEARENMKTLRKLRNKAAEWYGSMKASSADAWEQMKKGFSDAYKDLTEAWEKSEKELGSGK
ncbi:hypothetical protein GCM10011352_13990 [Marinobacterium zhoushanense]|uniref:Uncharacterized protein n=1 Tax=Marinobacterium zhoushanense TaxID=1679163 RepID=A0ABQ1K5V8_9GAMM|nr:hypothetical protein [Marinobacterium zhoushanense]GGB89207.1 hypothetical protein GCM10011352_13990 [Marinobacterium zhoushanense]